MTSENAGCCEFSVMKVVVVRVTGGKVVVEGDTVSTINKGLALFLGIEKDDTPSALVTLADKIVNLRIFENPEGKLSYSIKEKGYQILCIPNFTLCASTDKGRRPSFENSMPREEANKYFEEFVLILRAKGVNVQTGIFGKHMEINLNLDGPVNIVLEAK